MMCRVLSIAIVLYVGVTILSKPGYSYKYFGTKTSYFVTGSAEDSPIEVDGCQPALFWNLARHGTRNPGDDDILEMQEKLPTLRDKIVSTWMEGGGGMEEEDIELLMDWSFNLEVQDDSLLTESGNEEHREMGGRWRRRLPQLLLEKKRTEVRSSSKSRCVESGLAFLEGVFGSNLPEIEEDNKLLRFYDYCPKFINDVDENNETFVERNKFEKSDYFQEMVNRVNIKTGLPLDVPQIRLIWDICRFEEAWYPSESSPWCSVFSIEDLKLFEFQADLKYYYNDGAAYAITAEMTQPLFSDLFKKIEDVRDSPDANISILNFAHSETIQPFMTALGLFRDQEDLLASDWGTPRQQHQWQVSKIASFATNVDVVVFKCGENGNDYSEEDLSSEEDSDEDSSEEDSKEKQKLNTNEWKVMLFHQEKPLVQPACGEKICTIEEFIETYRHWAELDFDEVCNE